MTLPSSKFLPPIEHWNIKILVDFHWHGSRLKYLPAVRVKVLIKLMTGAPTWVNERHKANNRILKDWQTYENGWNLSTLRWLIRNVKTPSLSKNLQRETCWVHWMLFWKNKNNHCKKKSFSISGSYVWWGT